MGWSIRPSGSDMPEDPATKIHRHRRSGVLVDTNLLLVYFIGNYDYTTGYQVINESKYTKGTYRPEDFEILDTLLNRFDIRITTPHILAEVSNLIKLLPAGADEFCMALLKNTIPSLQERTTPTLDLAAEAIFTTYGVADVSIVMAAKQPCLVLTDDFRLWGHMDSNGIDALNFHHVKYVVAGP